MRRITILIFIIAAIGIIPTLADVPVEGMKQYNYQYLINNTADYPDYVFLTSSEIWHFENPKLVVNGTFGGGYKLDGFILHAIKETDLSSTIREQMMIPDQNGKNLSRYFETIPLATSDILLPVSTSMDDTIPLSNITVQLEINEISRSNLSITKMNTMYGYDNGTVIIDNTDEKTDSARFGDEELDLLHII